MTSAPTIHSHGPRSGAGLMFWIHAVRRTSGSRSQIRGRGVGREVRMARSRRARRLSPCRPAGCCGPLGE